MFRKWLCVFLSFALLLPLASGLAETAQGETLDYLYTFTPGTVLEGEGTETIRELLEALQLLFSRRKTDADDTIRLQLLSYGEEAFSLTAGESAGGEFALVCSLLGGNKLTLRRDQLSSFLQTLVLALGERGLLKGDNLKRMGSLADRMGKILGNYLDRAPEDAPDTGIDLNPYLRVLDRKATSAERREIPPEERDGSGAVEEVSYLLSGEYRRDIVNRAMDKVMKLPIISDQFRNGSLKIGDQVITDQFLRSVFGDTPGDMTMDVRLDENGQLISLLLHTPDISGLVTDLRFAQVQGVELSIARTRGEGKRLTSVTTVRLSGLEGDLLTMTLERAPGRDIPPMAADKVHAVGEMDSGELSELIRSMGLTIIANALNMVLTLPDCIAQTLLQRLLK